MKLLALLAPLALFALTACQSGGAGGSGPSSVTGSVSYRERIALPPNCTVEVKLLDVSLADAPATIIGQAVINNPRGVPVPFRITFDPARIDQTRRYSVSARITSGGRLLWISDRSNPVLTQGHPSHIEVVVVLAEH
ncbi:MAG: YbaY family lipoprotein [Phycisphaerae bacterium]|nr:YbaY family lipoprotein [Phycisphaerae bacterium]